MASAAAGWLGQGYTDNPRCDDDYTMRAVVAHAAAFLRAARLPPVHLVGHSRGGYCAARVTLEHPEHVRSLTLVDSGTLSPGVGLTKPCHAHMGGRPTLVPIARRCLDYARQHEAVGFARRRDIAEWTLKREAMA